jgi:hypothetical protein
MPEPQNAEFGARWDHFGTSLVTPPLARMLLTLAVAGVVCPPSAAIGAQVAESEGADAKLEAGRSLTKPRAASAAPKSQPDGGRP